MRTRDIKVERILKNIKLVRGCMTASVQKMYGFTFNKKLYSQNRTVFEGKMSTGMPFPFPSYIKIIRGKIATQRVLLLYN